MATTRLRLTAHSLANLCGSGAHAEPAGYPGGHGHAEQVHDTLRRLTAELARFYERIAVEVGPPGLKTPASVAAAALDGPDWQHRLASTGPAARTALRTLWVRDHLQHLGSHTDAITAPAARLAQQRRIPWWR